MKFIRIFAVFIGVWFVASLLNGLIAGISLSMGAPDEYGAGTFGLAMIFSFIFSIPLVSVVWFVTFIAQLAGASGFPLFRVVVITSLICAIAGAVFFIASFQRDFKEASYAAGFGIIVSAITAVTVFRHSIKKYETAV